MGRYKRKQKSARCTVHVDLDSSTGATCSDFDGSWTLSVQLRLTRLCSLGVIFHDQTKLYELHSRQYLLLSGAELQADDALLCSSRLRLSTRSLLCRQEHQSSAAIRCAWRNCDCNIRLALVALHLLCSVNQQQQRYASDSIGKAVARPASYVSVSTWLIRRQGVQPMVRTVNQAYFDSTTSPRKHPTHRSIGDDSDPHSASLLQALCRWSKAIDRSIAVVTTKRLEITALGICQHRLSLLSGQLSGARKEHSHGTSAHFATHLGGSYLLSLVLHRGNVDAVATDSSRSSGSGHCMHHDNLWDPCLVVWRIQQDHTALVL
mmetsp:Transcript_22750/g.37672  ORF Transcript_22750/g.37672 Transcript_22750/m.37672 type:complete len:320 (+) Transcript_22750:410-1369(+)